MTVLYQSEALEIVHQEYGCRYDMGLHGHEYLTLSVVLNGFVQENTEGARALAHGGHVSIKPVGALHGDCFLEDTTMISMRIHDPKWFGLEFCRWRWTFIEKAFPLFLNVIGSEDKKESVSVLGKVLSKPDRNPCNRLPVWLADVHRIVCRDFREPLSVSKLADSVGKHPVYLSRVFKKTYGTDIKSYRDKLRLGYAFAERLNKKTSLTSIAHECGFADQSHFNRKFKAVFGEPPGASFSVLKV